VAYLSKRFILSRYLQLSDDEIITNEMLLRQEKGMSPDGGDADLPTIYGAGGEDAGLGIGGGIGGGGLPPASGGPIGELDNGGEPGTGSESTSGGPSTNAGGSPLSGDLNSV
jgi:hypothetical protein